MDKSIRFSIIALVLVIFIFVPSFVFADGGPRPTREISVTYEGQIIKDNEFYAAYFRCTKDMPTNEDLNSYIDAKPFAKLGPLLFIDGGYDVDKNCYWTVSGVVGDQGTCKDSKCNFGYYGSSEFKFGVYLPDENKTFVSQDIIYMTAFHSTYKVNLLDNGDIIVKDTTAFYKTNLAKYIFEFLIALIFTIIIEIIIIKLFLSKNLNKNRIIKIAILANLISITTLWAVCFIRWQDLNNGFLNWLIVGEIFVFLFELIFIYILNKKYITFWKVMLMIFIANLASFILGGFLLFLIKIL
ncbi:MAG TPA: hypothetical protein PLK55_00450 [archaeon]|nr:hypothetical protein [archaeon]